MPTRARSGGPWRNVHHSCVLDKRTVFLGGGACGDAACASSQGPAHGAPWLGAVQVPADILAEAERQAKAALEEADMED